MAVTLGLMFRVDTSPPAVAIPPQSQPAHFNNNLVIDVEAVKEPAITTRSGQMFRGMPSRAGDMMQLLKQQQQQQQPLTYNQKGGARLPVAGGLLLDTYA
ncbi:hypothetical protein F3F96_04385 [Mariprofundus sp. NF]|uniref:hypothetical protein n=1 Tax=Mariprofundus sp. NF TaxID=2608716 RepID=UPI00159FFE70|nr:hypothetical protein [Mariprofundus sp. NF]NWF38365.1 hypothetical protein [Mariprofundus sp. NF]